MGEWLNKEAGSRGLWWMSFVARGGLYWSLMGAGGLVTTGHFWWALVLAPIVLMSDAGYVVAERELYRLKNTNQNGGADYE